MSEEEQAPEDEAPVASTDSAAVQDALSGIPGLSDAVGNQPAARTGADSMNEMMEEPEAEPMSFGTPKAPEEDSDTVQQALKQLGLQ
ncbi:hypothetical protein BH23ACT12_BH23ACT12_10780 [soil metagenome]